VPGRLVLGRVGRRLVAAEPRQSVVVFGPTQSRKTSGFAVPALLGWEGPVLATSVKTDLVHDTLAWRRSRGQVWCIDPTGVTGLPATAWSPLPASATWPGARRMAAALAEGGRQRAGTMEDAAFWYAAAAKLLAPLLFAAATAGRPVDDVVRWLDTREEAEVLDALEATGVDRAVQAAIASFARDERQRSSIYTTAETVMEPFADADATVGPGGDAGPVPAGRPPTAAPFDPALLVSGPNTAYLCAPAHDQRRLAPLFVAAVRQVVEHVYDTVAGTGRPLDPPLLVVLDEAANIAPLDDLDGLAATAAGHGIQLVTIWHDLAQLTARYGQRSATVVNNHRAKVYLSGIADPSTLAHAATLAGEGRSTESSTTSGGTGGTTRTDAPARHPLVTPDGLRRLAPGEGLLVYGGLPPARLTLRSWFEDPVLVARGRRRP
jgi:type IV secretion system protein VirD4